MLYELKFNSKTQLLNDLMKLKGTMPKSKNESGYYTTNRIDVNVTSEGIYLLATDGYRICSINFGKIKNFDSDAYSDEDKFFTISKSMFEDVIKYIRTLKKVESVKLKGGHITGVKVTGVNTELIRVNTDSPGLNTDSPGANTDLNTEKWFTESALNRLPKTIYDYVEYPKEMKRNINFKSGICQCKVTNVLLDDLKLSKKEHKEEKVVTLKLNDNTFLLNTRNTQQNFSMEVESTGNSKLVGFNREFLIHALRNLKNPILEFYDFKGPIRVLSGNIEQAIMPRIL